MHMLVWLKLSLGDIILLLGDGVNLRYFDKGREITTKASIVNTV